MSADKAKNKDYKGLAPSKNGNGANSNDFSTLKSSQSAKTENDTFQTEAQESLVNPFQQNEKINSSDKLKFESNSPSEINYSSQNPELRSKPEILKNSEIQVLKTEKLPVSETSLSFAEEQKQRKKQKSADKDIKLLNRDRWLARNGHTLTYVGLFLFTFVLYFRPYEWIPGFSGFTSAAMILAVTTLLIYIPAQLTAEGTLTILTTEVKCIIFLAVWALLTIPIGKDPANSWRVYNDVFIKIVVIFIISVNTLRTKERLLGLMWLSIGIGIMLSWEAVNLYREGKFEAEGYRVEVDFGGMFGNPNDMALHLVMFTPLAVVLGLISKRKVLKLFCFVSAGLMIAANMVTQSRGGFLGLIAIFAVLVWKLSKKNRLPIILTALFVASIIITFAPGNYWMRILSILIPGLDLAGSADQRRELLEISILVTLRNPLGIGIGNFPLVGIRNLQSHNAFTQVSSELGWLAFAAYLIFIISPIRKLSAIERQLFEREDFSWIYYLAIGLQATIIGYMVSSFFVSVAYQWFVYYPIAYAVCLRRIYKTQEEKGVLEAESESLKNYYKLQKV